MFFRGRPIFLGITLGTKIKNKKKTKKKTTTEELNFNF